MAEESLEEIKKLSPEERITRLREFQEKRKKEAAEAKDIIADSVAQIKQEEKIKEAISVPESKQVNVAGLFKAEEGLEATIEKEKIELTEEELQEHRQYQAQLSQEPAEELYQRVKSMYQQIKEGNIGSPEMNKLNDLSYAFDYKKNDIASGHYKMASEEIDDMMSASRSLINYMRQGK